ncbi:sterol 3-beta-glucosyltransferase UGT80B1 [Cucumis melo var. makuwa]|uniref:Sterol 3-beta-glucosyltransferase UGT80B1 n=1 Tax=Cucumis melo var. makuwa TaxID=1194695 RepID=A0A5D3DGD0_CUCMM|nr:sterol 3-beta-glucosyltransferase UGT80B1 [Cucumis melo var. makuwa]TYK22751.1 sterol 3-beta-glucosyltransferase UGT80B1 [Cucumis melo var. makuwa]
MNFLHMQGTNYFIALQSYSNDCEECASDSISSGRNLLLEEENSTFFRSMTEWIDTQRPDLKFDELSGDKQKQLVADLVKIQRDGTVKVDIEKNAPAVSELLKLHPTLEGSSPIVDDVVSESKKLIPRLKIAILVVGTRGDVQPFLAIARRLQACLKYFISFYY